MYVKGSFTIEATNIVSVVLIFTGVFLCCAIRLHSLQCDYYEEKAEAMRVSRYGRYEMSSDMADSKSEIPVEAGETAALFWDIAEVFRLKEGVLNE